MADQQADTEGEGRIADEAHAVTAEVPAVTGDDAGESLGAAVEEEDAEARVAATLYDYAARLSRQRQDAYTALAQELPALKRCGVDALEVTYDGCGDSGTIDAITAFPREAGSVWGGDAVLKALADHFYSFLPPGWEINAGSRGTLFLDVADAEITHTHYWREDVYIGPDFDEDAEDDDAEDPRDDIDNWDVREECADYGPYQLVQREVEEAPAVSDAPRKKRVSGGRLPPRAKITWIGVWPDQQKAWLEDAIPSTTPGRIKCTHNNQGFYCRFPADGPDGASWGVTAQHLAEVVRNRISGTADVP